MDKEQYVVIIVKDPDYYGTIGIVREEDETRYKVEVLAYTKNTNRLYIEVYKQNVKNLFNRSGKFIKPFKRTSAVQIIGKNTPYKGAYGDYTFINAYTLQLSIQLEWHIGGILNIPVSNIKFIPLELIQSYDIVKPSKVNTYDNVTVYSYEELILPSSDSRSNSGSDSRRGSSGSLIYKIGSNGSSGSNGSNVDILENKISMIKLSSGSDNANASVSPKKYSIEKVDIRDSINMNQLNIYEEVKKLYILLGVSISDDVVEIEILKELNYVLKECNVKQLYDIKIVLISYLYIKLNQHLGVTDYFSMFEPIPKQFVPVRRNFKTLIYIVVRLAEVYYFKADNILKTEDIYLELVKNVKKVIKVLNLNNEMFTMS